jgi:hypothetical protein
VAGTTQFPGEMTYRESKLNLQAIKELIDLLENAPSEAVVADAVNFVCAASRGQWHNRARARLARRLKHIALSEVARHRLVAAILAKLHRGEIDEQFRDQLRLAIHIDSIGVAESIDAVSETSAPNTRKIAQWVRARR